MTYSNRLRTSLSLATPGASPWVQTYAYDEFLRLTNTTSPAGAFAYQYTQITAGNGAATVPDLVALLSLPNGASITNNYDGLARLLSTVLQNSIGGELNLHRYAYDAGNQRTNTTRLDGSTVGFAYDKIGQLKVAAASVPSEKRGYVYDAAWNLNLRTNNGSLFGFVVTNNNELVTANGFSISYDANGNQITNVDSYFYDDENQLTQVSDETYHTFRSDFVYDGLGRLRQRLEYYWQNSQSPLAPLGGSWTLSNTVAYIYDGNRVIQERDGGNTPTTAYTRGTDLSGSLEGAGGIGGLLGRSSSYSGGNWGTHSYYHADGGGNITFMLDGNQGTVASYRYDPYGNLISKSGSMADANVYRFSSKELHVKSGMYYYLYRFYDPNLQRWINRDPIGELGGINLYSFVLNDPVALIDDSGAWPTGKFGSPQIHQASIDRVLSFLPESDRRILRDQQRVADEDQSTGCSYQHAMRAPDQSVAEATDLANKYVRQNIKTARSLEKQGRHTEAMQALGDAMHTLQDATSPAHAGFQQWDGLGGPGNLRKAKGHTDKENYDPGAKSPLDDATMKAWKYFQGEPMPKDCFK